MTEDVTAARGLGRPPRLGPDCPVLLDEETAEAYVASTCFKTGPPRLVGIELEWLVNDVADAAVPLSPARVRAALRDLPFAGAPGDPAGSPSAARPGNGVAAPPLSGRLTTEPGGQLELSSLPAVSPAQCLHRTAADLAAVRTRLLNAGLQLTGIGLDPLRPPRRVLSLPRYAAMEAHFDRRGAEGRAMMCPTAAVQICVDVGWDPASRWSAAYAMGPALVAAFANSPLWRGRPTGWRCTRQAVWSAIDPSRTAAPGGIDGERPEHAYARYALDAEVLCIRHADGPWSAHPGLTFRGWLRGDHRPPPTAADLNYHLSTLFPPVRARGHLELRYLDAQPGDGWRIPFAVATALLGGPAVIDRVRDATAPVQGRWQTAARAGLSDRDLRDAAATCFTLAIEELARAGVDADLRVAVERYAERYVLRGRCPADDVLDGRLAGRITDPRGDEEVPACSTTPS